MAKGSVRKKGRKWYYRFYIEDESGRQVQKEFAGTESKSETEALLRKAMEDYEAKRFVGKAENITVGEMLDLWIEEDLKPGSLSNGTVMAYTAAVKKIKKYPIGSRRLKTVTADHLQAFIDFMSYGGTNPDGTVSPPMSKGYMLQFSTVLQGAFRFAVFPKRLITFNPMQYVRLRGRKEEADIFCDDDTDTVSRPTITHEQYLKLTGYLKGKENPALLPVQIAYYTGLRIGEVCGLTWQDINLEEQYLTVRRSMRYKAQDRDREYQAEQSPHRGLLRHAGGNPAGGEGGAAQKPFPVRGALPPELLYCSKGKRPQLLRGLQPAEDGGSPRRVQGIILCLRQTGRDV